MRWETWVCLCCWKQWGQAVRQWLQVLRAVKLCQCGLHCCLGLCTGGWAEVQSPPWCSADLAVPCRLCFSETATLTLHLRIRACGGSVDVPSEQVLGTHKWLCSQSLHKPTSYHLLAGELEQVRNCVDEQGIVVWNAAAITVSFGCRYVFL